LQEGEVKPVFTGLAARLRNCQGLLVDSNILLDIATDFYRLHDHRSVEFRTP
jgi:hypothetical protein